MKAKEMQPENDSSLIKVRFSIGAKLITIISIIVLASLGSITALVSWLVREDLRIAAEENNFEVNRRSSLEAENTIVKMRSDSMLLMQALSALEAGGARGADSAKETVSLFFAQNPQVADLAFTLPGKAQERLTNERFFLSQGIDSVLAGSYYQNNSAASIQAVSGGTVLLNAAPHFGTSVLALFFPWRGGVGIVLFSPSNLNDSFSFGTNRSSLLNDSGDILINADFEQVRSGANIADREYIRQMYESPEKNKQMLLELDKVRYYVAYTKLNIAGAAVVTSIEYDKVFEGIAATTRRNLYLTAAVLCISIMLIWFFAKSISIPLKTLASAAHTIQGGNFKLDLKPKGSDEIGVLTASFNQMCTALGIFGRFTNREIAVKAMRGEIKPGGLPKHATIFFSDIRGFTEKSENFTKAFGSEASDRIIRWLNGYFTRMVECVEKTNGVVDKFIGDAVMAHWGAAYTAGSAAKDAYRCVMAALMMRNVLYNMNKRRQKGDPGDPPIRIGCGINTGVVTAGQIGSDLRMEYTVVGDPVNLASRTEALNKPLGTDILITEATWKLVGKKFITEEMPSVKVKGKEKPVRIFAVINHVGADKGPKTLVEVRKLMGIDAPDVSILNMHANEEKFQIGGKA